MMLMLMRWLCQRCGRWCAQDRCGGRRGPGRAAGHRSGTPRYWRAPLPREQCGRRHTRQVRVQVRPKAQRGRGVGASFRLPLHLLGLRRRLLHPPCPIPSAFLPLASASPNVCPPILFPPPSSSTLHPRILHSPSAPGALPGSPVVWGARGRWSGYEQSSGR
jgi:hypothetical protein